MNGKFSNVKKVMAMLVGLFMLIGSMPLGAYAADIAPEAVVYVRPEVTGVVANQIGMNYIYVDATTEGSDNDMPTVAYLLDASGEMVTLSYAPVNTNAVEIKLGVPDSAPTGYYTIVVALNKAADVFKSKVFYVGVGDVTGFFDAINMTEVEVDTVKEKLDTHYNAFSVIECTEDESGNVILKLTGEDYENLTSKAKTAFAELILNGVNGKYSDAKGTFDAENSESFVKEAYLVASYNADGISDEAMAELIYKFASVIGFDAEDENLYGKIQNKETLAKVVKTIDAEVDNVDELQVALEQAAAVQIVNETHWTNLVSVVEANNDLFQVNQSEIRKLLNTKKLRNLFCEEFKGTYYSVDEIKKAWDDAYEKALDEYSDNNGGGGTSSGPATVTTNKVSTQITNEENKKDPDVEIKDYYTDMSGTYSWASDAVLNLTRAQIVTGYGDKTFRPGNSVTRAEFMKMIVNVFGFADMTATSTFTDVDKDAWYYVYVASAEKLGIAQGYGNGLFGVNDAITRQDAITIVYRAAKLKGLSLETFSSSAMKLTDKNSIAPYAIEAVEALYNTGVYLDASDPTSINVFEPTRNASRAYLAVILNQIYTYIVK